MTSSSVVRIQRVEGCGFASRNDVKWLGHDVVRDCSNRHTGVTKCGAISFGQGAYCCSMFFWGRPFAFGAKVSAPWEDHFTTAPYLPFNELYHYSLSFSFSLLPSTTSGTGIEYVFCRGGRAPTVISVNACLIWGRVLSSLVREHVLWEGTTHP